MQRNFVANPALASNLRAHHAMVATYTDQAAGTISLDDLAEQTFTPDVIKIDIEGAELDALQGASRLLAGRHPSFLIEVHGEEAEMGCIETLRANGYIPQVVHQRRWFADFRPSSHNRWLVADSPRCRSHSSG